MAPYPSLAIVAGMARLEHSRYLDHLRTESGRFRDVLADCPPDAQVPACPDWRAADLLWHLTHVQDFWAFVVTNRPEPPKAHIDPDRPTSYGELLALFDDRSAALVDALATADPAEGAWSWAPEQTVGFTFRRQALEAMIHRVDAEQVAGVESTLPLDLAADGVHEMLAVMFAGCPPWGDFSPLPHYLRIDITDTDESVWVQLGRFSGVDPEDEVRYDEEDIDVVDDPGQEPDGVIAGEAAALVKRLWRRGDGAGLKATGDLSMVDRFREIVNKPIN